MATAAMVWANGMEKSVREADRVIRATLPLAIAQELDRVSRQTGRSKCEIVHQALAEWLSEEQRRFDLTVEALRGINEGRTLRHDEVLARADARKRGRRAQTVS